MCYPDFAFSLEFCFFVSAFKEHPCDPTSFAESIQKFLRSKTEEC
jgi:hypothetical protein